jgi:hypothetical protein
MRQNKWKGASLGCDPRSSFYAAPGDLKFNILLTLALETPIRQHTRNGASLTFDMLKMDLEAKK